MVKNNINIERAVLSALMFDPILIDEVMIKLQDKDFYLPFHKALYSAILELHKADKPIDENFLVSILSRNNSYDEVALLDVMASNPVSNVDAYVEEILEASNKRELSKIALNVRKSIEDGNSSTEALGYAQDALEKIKLQGFSLNLVMGNELKSDLPEFVLKNWIPIPRSALSLISADGGVGKSWWAIQAGVRFVIESNFTKKAFLWLSEDPQPVIKDRLKKIISFMGYSRDEEKILAMIVFTSDEPPSLLVSKGFKSFEISPVFRAMRRQLKEFEFIVFDPLIDFFGGDENSNSEFGVFFKPFKQWVAEENKSIVFLHHATKGNGGGFRGAGAIRTSMRIAYELDFVKNNKDEKIKDQLHERAVKLTKDNWGGGNLIKTYIGGVKAVQLMPNDSEFEVVYEESMSNDDNFFPSDDKVTMPSINI